MGQGKRRAVRRPAVAIPPKPEDIALDLRQSIDKSVAQRVEKMREEDDDGQQEDQEGA